MATTVETDSGVMARVRKRARETGETIAPRLTKVLTKDPNPEYQVWGVIFAYAILIVYIFVDLLQFVDIFSNNHQFLWMISAFRLLIYILAGAAAIVSIYNGWRTVEVSIMLQLFALGVGVIASYF